MSGLLVIMEFSAAVFLYSQSFEKWQDYLQQRTMTEERRLVLLTFMQGFLTSKNKLVHDMLAMVNANFKLEEDTQKLYRMIMVSKIYIFFDI